MVLFRIREDSATSQRGSLCPWRFGRSTPRLIQANGDRTSYPTNTSHCRGGTEASNPGHLQLLRTVGLKSDARFHPVQVHVAISALVRECLCVPNLLGFSLAIACTCVLRINRKIVIARLDLPLRLLEEALGGDKACRTCRVHPRHEIVELFLEIFERAQGGHTPRLTEPVLKDFGLMRMLCDSLKAHIEIESLVNSRRDASKQRTDPCEPVMPGLLLQDGPRRHGTENNGCNK